MQGGIFYFVVHNIFEYIFPVFCIICGREGWLMCEQCVQSIDTPGVFCCPVCHREQPGGVCCIECRGSTPLVRHVAMMPLSEISPIHKLIHVYKYDYCEEAESVFENLVTTFFETYIFPQVDFIVPVPLHRKRYVERGFNQSARIGRMISAATGIPYIDALSRVKNTVKQATLDRVGREENVRDAFIVTKELHEILSCKHIVLIDDVYTTGSTLRACAAALHHAGVREISGWSVARG